MHAFLSGNWIPRNCRPDHVPTMGDDNNENYGYSEIGRLFAIGYIKGVREAVYGS